MKSCLAILLLAITTVYQANSLCCPYHPTKNWKLECDDGSVVHPWQCCGSCNMFCCNCAGTCLGDNSTTTTTTTEAPHLEERYLNFDRRKREVGDDDLEKISKLFLFLDSNLDLKITEDEQAIPHQNWLRLLDADQDGVITPSEFHPALTNEIINKYIEK